jgi:hypothetical protein
MMLGFASYFGNAGAPMSWRIAGSIVVAGAASGIYAFFPFERFGLVSEKSRGRVDSLLLTYLLGIGLFAYAAPASVEKGDTWQPYVATFALPLGGVVVVMVLGVLGVGRLLLRKAKKTQCPRCNREYLTQASFCVVDGESLPSKT